MRPGQSRWGRKRPQTPGASGADGTGGKLPRNVVALGWVSLLTDAASDMIYPLLPLFLLELGGGPVALGWIEGVSEAVAAAMKLWAGRLTDRTAKKKPLVAIGYGVAALARPLYALATTPLHAVFVRAIDRVGKGLRGPPRDALVAGAVPRAMRGHAFGFHRMMDNFGGVVGPVLAFALLRIAHAPLRTVFLASLVPGLFSVALVLVAVRELPAVSDDGGSTPVNVAPVEGAGARAGDAARSTPPGVSGSPWSPSARRYFAAAALFALASSGDLFLVQRLTDLGLDRALVPFAWLSLQLAKGSLNIAGGKASDRLGRKPVLTAAWLVYAASYALFAVVPNAWLGWGALFVYAAHYGLAEGGQRALVAELVPAGTRGRAFGVQLALEGAMVLPANVGFGWLYAEAGGPAAFFAGAGIALAAAALLATVRLPPNAATRVD